MLSKFSMRFVPVGGFDCLCRQHNRLQRWILKMIGPGSGRNVLSSMVPGPPIGSCLQTCYEYHIRSRLFQFMSTLRRMVGWLLHQDTLIQKIKFKCSYVINVCWTSTLKVLKWLVASRKQATKHMQRRWFAWAPCETWRLVAIICFRYLVQTKLTFIALQVVFSVVYKQYENQDKLFSALPAHCQAFREESRHFDDPNVARIQNVV